MSAQFSRRVAWIGALTIIVVLAGCLPAWALWQARATMGGGTITAGDLQVTVGASEMLWQPTGPIYTIPAITTLEGNNLQATFTVTVNFEPNELEADAGLQFSYYLQNVNDSDVRLPETGWATAGSEFSITLAPGAQRQEIPWQLVVMASIGSAEFWDLLGEPAVASGPTAIFSLTQVGGGWQDGASLTLPGFCAQADCSATDTAELDLMPDLYLTDPGVIPIIPDVAETAISHETGFGHIDVTVAPENEENPEQALPPELPEIAEAAESPELPEPLENVEAADLAEAIETSDQQITVCLALPVDDVSSLRGR